MSQDTVFGTADTYGHMMVEKADGRVFYYRVAEGLSTEITLEQYEKETI